jgi:hypothetical protein
LPYAYLYTLAFQVTGFACSNQTKLLSTAELLFVKKDQHLAWTLEKVPVTGK